MSLINELKKEHKNILDLFDKLEKNNLNDKKLIEELRDVTIAHLEKEDKKLYSVLKSSKKEDVKNTAELFESNMVAYADKFVLLIEKALEEFPEISEETLALFNQVKGKLADRITIEESMLFSKFPKE